MWHDNETDKDFLGFVVHEKLVRSVITNDANLPVTFGLFGDWGSGKSSILKILKSDLEDKPFKEDTIVIYFDGWVFEGYDDAKSALMQEITTQLVDHKSLANEVKDNVKEKAKKVFKSIKWLRALKWGATNLVIPGVAAYATGGFSLIPFLLGKLRENKDTLVEKVTGDEGVKFLEDIFKTSPAEPDYSSVREFRESFSELIEATGKKRLIVLIDDLDRCSPQRIVENLEAIKLFLNVDKTAFVIAADEAIISDAVYSVYTAALGNRTSEEKRNLGKDYLEKLIQVPYNLPRLSSMEVETYINMLLCKSCLNKDEFEELRLKFQEFIAEKKNSIFDWENISPLIKNEEIKQKIYPLVSFMAPVSDIIASSMDGNPRLIKRFLNAYELRTNLLEVGGLADQKTRLALLKLMVIERTDDKLFQQLYSWQKTQDDKHVEELETLAVKKDAKYDGELKAWDTPSMRNLMAQEPKFSEIDMKTLFWATRASYGSAMTGLTLTSQAVRDLISAVLADATTDNMIEQSFIPRIKALTGGDYIDFFKLLDKKILSNPSHKSGYNVYFFCVDGDLPNAYTSFKSLLSRVTIDDIPGSMGAKFKKIKEKHSKDTAFQNLFKGDTEISRAMK